MKKLYLYTLAICLLAMACQQPKENHPQLPPDVESVAIIESVNFVPEYEIINDSLAVDTNFARIIGLVEINKNLRMKTIKGELYSNKYKYGVYNIPDTIRELILQTIDRFNNDSISMEEKGGIYDGYIYTILIKKSDGKTIRLTGKPTEVSPETDNISIFMRDSVQKYTNLIIANSDSIKEYIRRYEKYIPKVYELPPMPDLPIKKGYETPYY